MTPEEQLNSIEGYIKSIENCNFETIGKSERHVIVYDSNQEKFDYYWFFTVQISEDSFFAKEEYFSETYEHEVRYIDYKELMQRINIIKNESCHQLSTTRR